MDFEWRYLFVKLPFARSRTSTLDEFVGHSLWSYGSFWKATTNQQPILPFTVDMRTFAFFKSWKCSDPGLKMHGQVHARYMDCLKGRFTQITRKKTFSHVSVVLSYADTSGFMCHVFKISRFETSCLHPNKMEVKWVLVVVLKKLEKWHLKNSTAVCLSTVKLPL